MKNKVLQLLMLFCFACFGVARATVVTIGTGTNTGQNSLPVKTDWNYFLNQQIFTANEVGMSGAINAISFNYTNSFGAFSMSDIQVYMKHVSTTEFNSSSDMVMVSPSDKVFDGTFSALGAGWVTVNLDTPFLYDGNSNLLICFYTPVANFVCSNNNMFYYTNTPGVNSSMALYCGSYFDFTNIDYTFVAWANYDFRANIQIDITPLETIPYENGFENATPLANWTVLTGSTIVESGSNAHDGTHYLKFKGSSSNIVVLPQFAAPTNTLFLSFWTCPENIANSFCGNFAVGYMTNPSDANTFVALETYSYDDWTSGAYGKKMVLFDNAPANSRIAMRQYNCSTVWYWFVDDVEVKTIPSCPPPTGVHIVEGGLTDNTVTLDWNYNSGDMEEHFLQVSEYFDPTYLPWSAPWYAGPMTWDGLLPDTDYTFGLRRYCSEDDQSEPILMTIHTLPAPMAIPFTESFSATSIPNNWTRYRGLLNDVMAGTASLAWTDGGWSFTTSNGVFDNHARLNIYGTTYRHWLVTPKVAMQNNCQLSFELALTKFSGSMVPVTPGEQADDRFVVLASTNGGSTWTILREWNNTGSPYVYDNIRPSGEDVAIDLTAYQNTNLMIAFYGESTVAGGDNNLHIDNVSIDYIPACQKPTNFHVSSIAERSVVLSWDAPADQNHWEVGYKTDSDPYYMWWTEPIETPYLFSGHPNNPLQPETHYTVKIRPICGTTYGSFSKEIEFTTLEACPLPTNVHITHVTPHGVTAYFDPGSPTQTIWYYNYTTTNTPPTYANGSTTGQDHRIFYPEEWGMFQPETHYYLWVGIQCPESGQNYIWGEPAEFTTPSPCAAPTNLTITNVTPHGVTATFEPGGDWQTIWSFNYTTTNVPPTYANGTTLSHTINYPEYWEAFQSNTHYYLWVGIECEGDGYVWGEPAEFTTPEACPTVNVSHEVEIEDIQPHSVSLSWEAYQGMATQWQVYHSLYEGVSNDEEWINEVSVVTDEPYVTIDGLLGDYDYHFWIRSYCGEWQGSPEWSSWSDMITVHTLVSCPMPTNLVATTTANSATITWTPGQPDQHSWTVEITSEDWGDYLPEFEVDVPYITFDEEFLDGMIDDGDCYEKSFTVYVSAECGEEDGSSEPAELEFIVTDRQFFTVYDGEETNNRIPAYIFYFDDFTRSQFVIPAEELTEMIGTPISSMTFYTSYNDYYTTESSADVYLKEVGYTSISAYEPKSSATIVYSGNLEIVKNGSGGQMTINFSTPYNYQGGNLLVGIENTNDVNYLQVYFYGQEVGGASISGSTTSSTGTVPATQQNFIPKTTFGFLPTCEPKSLPYSYGFEDPNEFNCWTKLNCHNSSAINSSAAFEGSYGFRFRYNYTPPQYLISPQFDGTTGVKVSFYYKNSSDTYPETFQVGYSTTTKSPNAFIWSGEVTANDQNTWELYEGFLPIGTKYVAIKLTSYDKYFLYLDNFNFEPAFCADEDQCELTFTLTDSYGDGWNGNAIRVVDVESGSILATLANEDLDNGSGVETQTVTLPVCDGRELRFEWVNGQWSYECSYTVTDISGNVVFSGSGVMSDEYFTPNCTPVFIANGFWNDGSKWCYGVVPEEGSDVIIQADAVIPAGYTAYAWDVTLNGGSITVEDGGQLWHRTDNLVVTMKKNIVGYGDANSQNHYYLLAHPFNDNIPVPSEMTAAGCDLYKFNGLEPGAEWRNNRQEPINELRQLSGYLFASPIDLELSFTGSTTKSGSYYLPEVQYYEDPNSNFNGWALWGNFLTCNIYVYTKDDEGEYVPMDVMVYNEAGEKVMLSAGPIPPMSAYFLKLTQTMTVYFLYYRVKPEGVINSLFTVNSNGDQVRFSQGNLQYIGSASTPYWKFADNQWEILGDNGQGSTSQNVDRDLFGWGTSGYNHGSVCYQPWNTSEVYADYRPYGSTTTNLYDETGKAEWGYNAISNGGNTEHLGWRTMTRSEWGYVFNQRTTPSGIRYAKAIVNGVKGMVLLPDDWNASYYSLNATNTPDVNFTSNTIPASQWSILEEHGAVFLPESGWRSGTDLNNLTSYGTYWSSQEGNNTHAGCINFNDTYFSPTDTGERFRGFSVRLVFPTR